MFSCHSTWCAVSTLFCPIFRVRTSSIFLSFPPCDDHDARNILIGDSPTFKIQFPPLSNSCNFFSFISSPLRRYELGLEPQVEFQLHENMQIMKQVVRGIN